MRSTAVAAFERTFEDELALAMLRAARLRSTALALTQSAEVAAACATGPRTPPPAALAGLPGATVFLPVVCCRCKREMGTKPGFSPDLAGTVSHGVCKGCLSAYRKEMLG